MVKTVHAKVDEEQWEWLNEVKDRYGLTWKGMLLHAARDLEGEDDAGD